MRRKTKRLFLRVAMMLLLVMMLTTATAWAQTTITLTTPSQDGDGYYLIGTAAELYGFAELVNNGNATANAKLTADIVVNENVLDANGEANTGDFVQWTPIGNDSFEGKVYSGTFDGQGHTISGLYASGSGWDVGLIGKVDGTATIRNLGVVDSYFSSSNNMLGSIVGGVSNNSSVTLANVYSTSTVKGDNFIGGLVGGDGSGSVTIINSYFAGTTSAGWSYGSHHDDLVSGEFVGPNSGTLTVVNTFVLGTSNHGTSATAAQLTDGTVAAALHYYQDALADGSMWGISGGKTDFSGTIGGVSVTTADITLHTFDGDATVYSSKYIVGNTTPLPVKVVRDGYTFFGWYDNANLEGDAVTQISSSATGDKEYWAKFERSHAVSFVLNGGNIYTGEIDHYIEGETTVLPSVVTKNGASFEGWYTTENFTGDRYYAIPATATEDMTFYAKWGAAKTTFYLMQGGKPVSVLYEGENIVWLDAATMPGYRVENQGNAWGDDYSSINVPYTGGESTFGNGGRLFSVSQSGFYLFTLTDKGEGNWFVSVLKSMLNCDVASIPTQVYTGSAIEPDVTVKDGETTLTLGTDYEVAYSNNVNAGTATVTITGKGNYSGETAATFTIVYPTVTTSYVDATGTLHENVIAIPLDNTMTTISAGWYVVNSDVTFSGDLSTYADGEVHIILCDGATLTANNITRQIGGYDYLRIYGQSQGTGTANISGEIEARNSIKIYGGKINVTKDIICDTGGVGIYGGNVTAADINGFEGSLYLTGGTITASSLTVDHGDITLGGATVTAGSYNVTDGNVTILPGITYYDGMGAFYTAGNLGADQITAIAGKTLTPAIVLADNADNTSAIATAATLCTGGKTLAVQLSGRTLYKDGKWNTLCLPFDVTLSGSVLDGAIAKTLTGATMSGNVFTLTFGDAVTELKAGTPYIIMWDKANDYVDDDAHNIVNPVFTNVVIDNSAEAIANKTITKANGNVRFIGYYDPFDIDTPANDDIYYMKANNSLTHTAKARTLKACRAYFQFTESATAGRNLVLDFGDGETTGISENEEMRNGENENFYDLNGRKLNTKPTKPGLYIRGNKKIYVK